MKLLPGVYFTVAPGVSGHRGPWGHQVFGDIDALLKHSIIEAEWLPELPKRVAHLHVGGVYVRIARSKTTAGVQFIDGPDYLDRVSQPPRLPCNDGRAVVAWADCAWQPDAHSRFQAKCSVNMREVWSRPEYREKRRVARERKKREAAGRRTS